MDYFVGLLSVAGVYFLFKLIEFRDKQYQKMIDKRTGKIKTTRQRLLELEEEVFLLKHNITYDSRLEKISYSTASSHSVFNNSYQVEVHYLAVNDYNADNLIIEIYLEGKVIKELETYQISFEDIRSIYEFISHKIKEMERDERNMVFEFEKSDDFKNNIRDNLSGKISKGVKIIKNDKD